MKKKQIVAAQLKTFEDLKQVEIERTKNQIEESNKRVDVLQKEFDKVNAFALTNPFGESTKDKKVKKSRYAGKDEKEKEYLKRPDIQEASDVAADLIILGK